MSLILEALNRADRDRSAAENSPNLQAAAINIVPEDERSYHKPLIAIAVALLAALGWYYFTGEANNHIHNLEISHKEPAAAPALKPTTSQAIHKPTLVSDAQPAQKQPVAPAAQNNNPAIAQLYKTQQAPKNTTAEASATINSSANIAPKRHKTAKLPPFLSNLPINLQKNIPTLDYDQHIYLANQQSYVEINNKIIKEGAAINSDLSLESIQENFIILRYQNTRFRLGALNSWVNFQ
ncbi:general secretion pathway protein GspB [Dasania sp. GY-MA-18]|uniref:General secretion pathway protein GspB n=1 Tax=Dasania phycosphaerae TaxID=2950436 RepID=A0A9J6RMB8_9GAMM|nr:MULTISPECIES: general secretion pathway protein GspB [Dasania]MCR8923227.1 general secretion pathway protein GspB [Dasania sp. GY-MA-18]MCZ0865659.1 general secretion pathway protein GspB [Dasania phycosphaerae]MCZ0869384.1 general secretion pathway protein GspB [Dasania phycosphaerae]